MKYGKCIVGAGLLAVMAATAHAQTLKVAADPWCPYNCKPGSKKPGYVIEILQATLGGQGYAIDYKIVPWDRAMADTAHGKLDAAVAATQEQAQKSGLIIGKNSVGNSNDCLWVKSDNPLKFSIADDLNGLKRVGIVSGYSYAHELGAWIKRPANTSKIESIFGENTTERSAQKLLAGRLDAFIENGAVVTYTLGEAGLADGVRSAGCQESTPVYIAFSPKLKNVDAVVKQFDDEIETLRKNGKLKKILAAYGLKPWW